MPRAPEDDARPSGLALAQLQSWFLARVVGPHRSPGDKPATTPPVREVAEVILPSATLSSDERIDIYSQMYMLRLRGILANEHPVVERLLGDGDFAEMARDYLSRFPPQGRTLRPLPHAFPHYLRHHCKRDDAALLLDVARLEHAVSESFDTPFFGTVTARAIETVPAAAWPEIRFRMDPSFRSLAFSHNAPDLVDAYHEQRELPPPAATPAWAVVWRHDNRVWRQPVSESVYTILTAFAAGETVTSALERGMEVWEGDEAELENKIFQWFANWMNEGFFSAIVMPL